MRARTGLYIATVTVLLAGVCLLVGAQGCRRAREATSTGPRPAVALPPPSSAGPSSTEGNLVATAPGGGPPGAGPGSAPRWPGAPPGFGPESEEWGSESELIYPTPSSAANKIGGKSYTADAKGSACLSNARQINVGLLSYAMDYDGRFPAGENWGQAIGPYTRSPELFTCPSDDRAPSYWHNTSLAGRSLLRLRDPSVTVTLFESDDLKTVVYRHNDGGMFGFADGHARWIEKGWERKDPIIWSIGPSGGSGSGPSR